MVWEKVDTSLDGRPYDQQMVRAQIASVIATNPGAVVNMYGNMQNDIARRMDEMAPPRVD